MREGAEDRIDIHGSFSCEQVFQKKLSHTDVKYHRLLIPIENIIYFPQLWELGEDASGSSTGNLGVREVVFYDRELKPWKFHLHRTNHSFCLGKGWKKFRRHTNLKVQDFITFYKLESRVETSRPLFMINVSRRDGVWVFGSRID